MTVRSFFKPVDAQDFGVVLSHQGAVPHLYLPASLPLLMVGPCQKSRSAAYLRARLGRFRVLQRRACEQAVYSVEHIPAIPRDALWVGKAAPERYGDVTDA